MVQQSPFVECGRMIWLYYKSEWVLAVWGKNNRFSYIRCKCTVSIESKEFWIRNLRIDANFQSIQSRLRYANSNCCDNQRCWPQFEQNNGNRLSSQSLNRPFHNWSSWTFLSHSPLEQAVLRFILTVICILKLNNKYIHSVAWLRTAAVHALVCITRRFKVLPSPLPLPLQGTAKCANKEFYF